jgi:hypothetical protein
LAQPRYFAQLRGVPETRVDETVSLPAMESIANRRSLVAISRQSCRRSH